MVLGVEMKILIIIEKLQNFKTFRSVYWKIGIFEYETIFHMMATACNYVILKQLDMFFLGFV